MPTGIRLKGQKIMNRLNIALTRRGLLAAGAAGTAAAAGISSSASAQTASSATASTARKGFDAAAKNGAKFAPEPLPIQDAQGLKLTHSALANLHSASTALLQPRVGVSSAVMSKAERSWI